MKMLVSFLFVVSLVAGSAGQGTSNLQVRRNPRAANRARLAVNPKQSNGPVFDFAEYGGAAAYLAAMEPDKLQRLMGKGGWKQGKGKPAKLLDSDPALVGASTVTTAFAMRSTDLLSQGLG
jgi:hypothetical protein